MIEASPKQLWAAVTEVARPVTRLPFSSISIVQITTSHQYAMISIILEIVHATYFLKSIINEDCKISLAVYEVERLLYRIKPSSPGLDNIPSLSQLLL